MTLVNLSMPLLPVCYRVEGAVARSALSMRNFFCYCQLETSSVALVTLVCWIYNILLHFCGNPMYFL